MIDRICHRRPDESYDEYLIRVGDMKTAKQIKESWEELKSTFNYETNSPVDRSESYYRKKYHKLVEEIRNSRENNSDYEVKSAHDTGYTEIQKQRMRLQDERAGYNRMLRSQARQDEILQLFEKTIPKYAKRNASRLKYEFANLTDKSIYVMLSDIHYGLTFSSLTGKYNTEIAKERIMNYAAHIIELGIECKDCYVSLMGDMISGNIHQAIRIENKENLIQQIVGCSELIAEFLYILSENFETVYVNNVDGNHSRIDPNLENVLRNERFDSLIPWYCKTKLENIENIEFVNNKIDPSIGSFEIYNKLYVIVHGDLEKDLKVSTHNIEKSIGRHIDYMLAAHTHVSEMRCEDTMYIRNGCVCGSGDDYTMKKRLYGPATQVCLVCSEKGVDSIHPIIL